MNNIERIYCTNVKSEAEPSEPAYGSRLKCGEILLIQDEWTILFRCNVCDEETQNLDYFLMHSLEHHLSVKEEDIELLVEQSKVEQEFLDGTPRTTVHSEGQTENELVLIENPNSCCDESEEEIPDYEYSKANKQKVCKSEDDDPNDPDDVDEEDDLNNRIVPKKFITIKSGGITSYVCEICGEKVGARHRYITHMRRHKGIKPYTCEFCDATFVDISNCNTHRKRHLNIKPHVCEICSKGFISTTELKFHIRTHTGERPHECSVCDRSFRIPSQLNKHLRRHTNERPHVCATCGKRFYDSTLLKDHEISHTNDRPYACELCDTKFSRRKALLQHMKLHSGVKKYTCKICFKAFAQGPGLYSHMKNHHRNITAESKS